MVLARRSSLRRRKTAAEFLKPRGKSRRRAKKRPFQLLLKPPSRTGGPDQSFYHDCSNTEVLVFSVPWRPRMKLLNLGITALSAVFATALIGQSTDTPSNAAENTLKVSSRAVLVDVIVTDKNGNAVKGLKQGDFRVLEQGKKQSISYFEEHTADLLARRGQNRAFPPMPPNVFTNFSPL